MLHLKNIKKNIKMNNMSDQTIGSSILQSFTDMLNNTIKEADTELIKLSNNPYEFLEKIFYDSKDLILS